MADPLSTRRWALLFDPGSQTYAYHCEACGAHADGFATRKGARDDFEAHLTECAGQPPAGVVVDETEQPDTATTEPTSAQAPPPAAPPPV